MNSRSGEPSGSDNFALDRNGKPIVDRFGRPVRKRSAIPEPKERKEPLPRSTRRSERRHAAEPRQRSASEFGTPSTPPRSRASRSEPLRSEPLRSEPQRSEPPLPKPPEYRRGAGRPAPETPRVAPLPPLDPPVAHPAQPSRWDTGRHYAEQPRYPEGGYEISSRRAERARLSAPVTAPDREGRRRKIGGREATSIAPRPPKRKHRFGFFKILGALLTVLILLLVGTAIWIDTSLQRTDALASYDGRVGNTAGTNWLLVGSDSRAGMTPEDADRLMAGELDDTVGRTDTIMVVHVPTFGGKPTMMSLPRDSWVNIPGYGENKINQAFSLGGPQLLQRTIEEATGLRIDRYAEIGFGGFAGLVDSVGGIEMCLNEPLVDPMAGIDLQAGCQKMNGPTALGYVRSRYASANGDLDRVERQRQFLSALSNKLSSAGTLLNPFRSLPALDALTSSVTVNDGDHVWNLAGLAMAMSRGPEQKTVPVGGYMDTYAGNALLWDEAGAEQLFSSLR